MLKWPVLFKSAFDMRYGEILIYGVYTDLQTEVSRRFLGFLWWGIEPILFMAVFYLVFGVAMKQGDENYVSFLLIGLLAWKWFDGSVRLASNAIVNSAALVQQIYLPKEILTLIPILSNTFKFLIVLVLLLVFIAFKGHTPTLAWLALLPIILCQLMLIISVGMLLASIVPFALDLRQIIDNLLMLLMFMSGIFFSLGSKSEVFKTLFDFNPIYILISAYRSVLLQNQTPDWWHLGYTILFSFPILCLALYLLKTYDRKYPKLMM